MIRIDFRLLAIAAVFAFPSLALFAEVQDAAATFQSKCAACHGANGTGSPAGKKMGVKDLTTAEVQKLSDAQLAEVITNGKNKMPKFGSLQPEEIKGLVAYIRTLKK
jgi:cytochrome c6